MCYDSNSKTPVSVLREACFELNALAYLIKLKKPDDISEYDLEDINYGIGRILDRSTDMVRRVMIELEESEIEQAARKQVKKS